MEALIFLAILAWICWNLTGNVGDTAIADQREREMDIAAERRLKARKTKTWW